VLDGQSRLLVAQSLGIKDVPSIYMDNPTRTDLNEKIKEFEKQYIPSQEVKPTEEKSKNEEFKPTEEEIKISETAAPEQRAQALKQTKESYGTQSSIEGVGEPAAPISEDVLSKPVKDIVKSAEPAEQSAFDKWRGDRYKSEDEFKSEYGKEHFKEFGETEEEYLRRKFCE
jgi:ParB-like chromosome segregation protein Spo0J